MKDSSWTKGLAIVLMLVGVFSTGWHGVGWGLLLVGFVLFLSGRMAEG